MLAQAPARSATEILPSIDFDTLIARREEIARNELHITRTPDNYERYRAFQLELEETGETLHSYMLNRFALLGGGVLRAALWADEYPANITPDEDQVPAVHYNLWLGDGQQGPDLVAGEEALDQLIGRDPSREAHCFKRPPAQSIPQANGFPFVHAHIFTTATAPVGGVVVMGGVQH